MNDEPISLDELIRLVDKAVNHCLRWFMDCVEGFDGIDTDDRRSLSMSIAYLLYRERCSCGLRHCALQHRQGALPDSGQTAQSFVFRAVIGPYGLKTRSVTGGMLFPFLKEEYGVREALVRFCCCPDPECGKLYEGNRCVRCGIAFSEETTEVIGVPWIVKEGVY